MAQSNNQNIKSSLEEQHPSKIASILCTNSEHGNNGLNLSYICFQDQCPYWGKLQCEKCVQDCKKSHNEYVHDINKFYAKLQRQQSEITQKLDNTKQQEIDEKLRHISHDTGELISKIENYFNRQNKIFIDIKTFISQLEQLYSQNKIEDIENLIQKIFTYVEWNNEEGDVVLKKRYSKLEQNDIPEHFYKFVVNFHNLMSKQLQEFQSMQNNQQQGATQSNIAVQSNSNQPATNNVNTSYSNNIKDDSNQNKQIQEEEKNIKTTSQLTQENLKILKSQSKRKLSNNSHQRDDDKEKSSKSRSRRSQKKSSISSKRKGHSKSSEDRDDDDDDDDDDEINWDQASEKSKQHDKKESKHRHSHRSQDSSRKSISSRQSHSHSHSHSYGKYEKQNKYDKHYKSPKYDKYDKFDSNYKSPTFDKYDKYYDKRDQYDKYYKQDSHDKYDHYDRSDKYDQQDQYTKYHGNSKSHHKSDWTDSFVETIPTEWKEELDKNSQFPQIGIAVSTNGKQDKCNMKELKKFILNEYSMLDKIIETKELEHNNTYKYCLLLRVNTTSTIKESKSLKQEIKHKFNDTELCVKAWGSRKRGGQRNTRHYSNKGQYF